MSAAADMDTMLTRFQQIMKETIKENNEVLVSQLDKSVDAKIAALRTELMGTIAAAAAAAPPPTPPPTHAGPAFGTASGPSAPQSSGWSAFGPSHAAAARPASAKRTRWDDEPPVGPRAPRAPSDPPLKKNGQSANSCLVWAVGFPRPLLASTLRAHGEQVLSCMMVDVAGSVTIKAHNLNKNYSLLFPSAKAAAEFLDTADCLISDWTDPRDEQEHPIRFKADRSLETRYAMKVMGSLYGSVKKAITDAGEWKDSYKLGTTGPRGTLFLSDGEDVLILFKVRPTTNRGELTCTIEPYLPALLELGIGSLAANAFLDLATEVHLGSR
jgi:hypothetical protein